MAKKIVVYCCGGTGVNIGKLIEKEVNGRLHAEDHTPSADIQIVNIDTSDSDLRTHKGKDNTYLFKGMDGSGSDRTMNKDEIEQAIPEILNRFRPGDLSIVINSCGGGSGSVIGPLLLVQLLAEAHPTIAIGIENTDTVTRLRNTVKVLNSYEGIAQSNERVIPTYLCDGSTESEANINSDIVLAVESLSILFSGEIDRLDSADLRNWINYNNVTKGAIGAMKLMIFTDPKVISDDMTICSVVTLANSPDVKVKFPRTMEYHPVGILENAKTFQGALHFALVDGPIQETHAKRKAELADAERQVAARKPRQSIANVKNGGNGIDF